MRAESTTAIGTRASRSRPVAGALGALACGLALVAAGCGNTPRQDADEPAGEYPVKVVEASFPKRQQLAKDSRLTIKVRNTGEETIPVVNVQVDGFNRLLRDPANPSQTDPSVADPVRPVFVVEQAPVEFLRNRFPANQSLVDREVNPPYGKGSAYVGTYPLGELPPGETALFRWDVSAVEPGPYKITWRVNAGLDGRAVAVREDGGGVPKGKFTGKIDSDAPFARVDEDDGETILRSDRRPPTE